MHRRRYLAALGTATTALTAGCGFLETRSGRSPPLVEDRPDAVYVPTHVEGMQLIDVASAGRLRLALSYSFPHRFWTVTSDRTTKVTIGSDDSVHLMVSVWDAESGRVIPSSNARFEITRLGAVVAEKSMWPMLSQNMGFHYGDNVALEGEGTYEVTVQFGPIGTRRTGDFADAFGEQVTRTFSFEFSRSTLEEISFTRLRDRQGERDAVDPMSMEMLPVPQLPSVADLPGRSLGTGTSGDGTFPAVVLDERPAGVSESGPYLAVSPRTPYNRFPLPFMSLSATLARNGTSVFSDDLTPTLDPDLAYHYGAPIDGVESGDTLTLTPSTPQVSRHEGYETAFLEMDPVELSV